MAENDNKKIEIYALSGKIDKISIEEFKDESIKVTVDLSNVKKEEEYLSKKNLISPIRERENFEKVYARKEALKFLKEMARTVENEETIRGLEKCVHEGDKAIEYLMKTFEPCAFSYAKGWIHNDRIIKVEDWKQIVEKSLYEAIINYSLDCNTQFTTYLRPAILRDCKENKHKSSVLSVNASAMHKARLLRKAEEEVVKKGGSIDDDYAVAKEMGRDVSTPAKMKRFKEMREDMQNVFVQGVSTETCYGDNTRTVGDSIASNYLNGEELLLKEDYTKRMESFMNSLPQEYRAVIEYIKNPTCKKAEIKGYDRIVSRLACNEEFKSLLKEGKALSDRGIL